MEMKIDIMNVEYSTTEKKDFVKMQITSQLILKFGDVKVAREISNTISIFEKDNRELLKLIFENSKASRKSLPKKSTI
jgi:hypothetical protein